MATGYAPFLPARRALPAEGYGEAPQPQGPYSVSPSMAAVSYGGGPQPEAPGALSGIGSFVGSTVQGALNNPVWSAAKALHPFGWMAALAEYAAPPQTPLDLLDAINEQQARDALVARGVTQESALASPEFSTLNPLDMTEEEVDLSIASALEEAAAFGGAGDVGGSPGADDTSDDPDDPDDGAL